MAVSLGTVAKSFSDEVDEIEAAFLRHSATTCISQSPMHYYPMDDGCLVSLWDAWNRFMRELYLSSTAGPTVGASGTTYTPAQAMTEPAALRTLIQAARVRGSGLRLMAGEPKWYQHTAAADIARALGLANSSPIVSAVTSSTITLGSIVVPNPIPAVQKCRNYVAHKSMLKAAELRHGMSTGIVDLGAHMRERTTGGAPRFSDWCEAITSIAWNAVT